MKLLGSHRNDPKHENNRVKQLVSLQKQMEYHRREARRHEKRASELYEAVSKLMRSFAF